MSQWVERFERGRTRYVCRFCDYTTTNGGPDPEVRKPGLARMRGHVEAEHADAVVEETSPIVGADGKPIRREIVVGHEPIR